MASVMSSARLAPHDGGIEEIWNGMTNRPPAVSFFEAYYSPRCSS